MSYRNSQWISRVGLVIFWILTGLYEAEVAASPQTGSATPTLVQHVQESNTLSPGGGPSWIGGPNNRFTIYLPNPSQGGNCIVVGMRFDNSQLPTITVSDDKSNIYNLGNVTTDSANANKFAIYYALNVAAGTRQIQVLLSSSTAATQFAVMATEFYNVAAATALDGNSGSSGTSSAITAGGITPTASGDLVYQIATQGTGSSVTYTAGSQSNITWSLLSADAQKPFVAQYGVYNSTATINPTMEQSGNVNFETSAILLKSASTGSPAPAGITVNRISHHSLWSANTGGPGYSTSENLQFPSVGPLLVAAVTTGGGSLNDNVTGISDNNNNTWQSCGPGLNASNHTEHFYYTANANTGSTETLTVHSVNNTGDSTVLLYDISGASLTPCDTTGTASGNQTSPVTSMSGPTVTPTTSNGLVIAERQHYYGTIVSVSGTNMLLDASLYSQENVSGPENVDENGGFAHYYNSTTSPVTFNWGYKLDGNNTAEQDWTAYAAAFKAGGGVAPPPGVSVTISPTSLTLAPSATQQFAAAVSGSSNTAVRWSVTCGSITTSGSYTAPGTAGSCVVTATSVADPTKLSSATMIVSTALPPPSFTPVHIKAGSAYTDSTGVLWSPSSTYCSGGNPSSSTHAITGALPGATDQKLYQDEQWLNSTCKFTVPTGNYIVTLKLTETAFAAVNKRLFSITINGNTVLSQFDIYLTAGGEYKALDETFAVTTTGTPLVIGFVNGTADDAKYDSIQIVAARALPQPVTPNCTTTSPTPSCVVSGMVAGQSVNVTLTDPVSGTVLGTAVLKKP